MLFGRGCIRSTKPNDLPAGKALYPRGVPEAHQFPQRGFLQKFQRLTAAVALADANRRVGVGPRMVPIKGRLG